MSDLISRNALLDWVNEQRKNVAKKQEAGSDQSIFTRDVLVTMQRCISTFETAINIQSSVYEIDKVVEELEKQRDIIFQDTDSEIKTVRMNAWDKIDILNQAIEIVKQGSNA